MKKIILTIFFLSSIGFATDYYVDGSVSSSGNGLSWATAWKTLANINWSVVDPGETVYISGGTSGKTYSGSLSPPTTEQGTATNYIKIFIGKYAPDNTNHSGTVTIGGILLQTDASAQKYIHIKGFEVTGGNVNLDCSSCSSPPTLKGIILDSLYIHDYGAQFGIRVIVKSDSLIIQNCIIIDCLNPLGDCAGQRDCVHLNYWQNAHPINTIIRNCWMEMRSQDPSAHNDVIQSVHADGFTIYNNTFISDSVNSPEGGGMPLILSSNDDDQNDYPPVILFNNFCYMGGLWYPGASDGRVLMTRHDGGGQSTQQSPTYIFNNTLVNSGPRDQVADQEYHIDFFSNNIDASFCLSAYRSNGWYNSLDATDAYGGHIYRDSTRHNLFWREGNDQGFFGGSFYTTGSNTFSPSNWSTWISGGGTGVNADPLFVDHFGHEPDQSALTGNITASSPAIDAGENLTYLANFLATTYNLPNDIKAAMLKDKNGIDRGSGSGWDIGAFEIQQGEPGANFKIMGVTVSKIQGITPSKVYGIQ